MYSHNFGQSNFTAHNHSFGQSKIKAHNCNFRWSKTLAQNRYLGRSKITAHNHYFGRSKVTANNRDFVRSKITAHNGPNGRFKITYHRWSIGPSSKWTVQNYVSQVVHCQSSITTFRFHEFERSKLRHFDQKAFLGKYLQYESCNHLSLSNVTRY